MSWQAYVDNLKQYPDVTDAALAGLDGAIWAISPGFQITQAELAVVAPALTNPASPPPTGFFVNGEKFLMLRLFDSNIDAKSKDNPANLISIAKSGMALVVASHMEPAGSKPTEGMAQKMNTAATSVRDYLKSSGY